MRSKIIILLSMVTILVFALLAYKSITGKSIDGYVEGDEPFYETKIDGYEFYVEEVDDVTSMNVVNMLSLLGIDEDVSVSDMYLSEDLDEMDMDRDMMMLYTDDIDFSSPVYTVYMGGIYYVYYDTSGVMHGMHLDSDYNLIELR